MFGQLGIKAQKEKYKEELLGTHGELGQSKSSILNTT